MKRLSLLVLGLLALPCVVQAEIVTLKDGTKIEGELKRAGDNYTIKTATGTTTVAIDKVQSIELHAQLTKDAVMDRLRSLRRAADNMSDVRQILDRYRTFIDQNPGTPAAAAAEVDVKMWQDRQDHGFVKVADKWMTPDDRDALRAKSADVAIALHDMLKAGRMKESALLLDKSLAIDPQNASFLYIQGVMKYQQEFMPPSRKAFEAVMAAIPDHAPTLNNLAVILWRQHAPVPAMGYYDRAMLAAPANLDILNNVAEALNALPKDLRESIVTKKVVRHFKEQDDVLQKKMAQLGQYRWGSGWVNEKELKKLQDDEKVIKDQLTQMGNEFDGISKKIAAIDRQISDVVNEMNQIEAQTYAPGPNGTQIRLPYPPIYFTLSGQLGGLRSQRAARVEEQEALRRAAKKAQSQLPAPRYIGLQKIIDVDGVPLPAGVHLPSPLPPPAAPAPAPAPPAAAPVPPANAPAPAAPATQPAGNQGATPTAAPAGNARPPG